MRIRNILRPRISMPMHVFINIISEIEPRYILFVKYYNEHFEYVVYIYIYYMFIQLYKQKLYIKICGLTIAPNGK